MRAVMSLVGGLVVVMLCFLIMLVLRSFMI